MKLDDLRARYGQRPAAQEPEAGPSPAASASVAPSSNEVDQQGKPWPKPGDPCPSGCVKATGESFILFELRPKWSDFAQRKVAGCVMCLREWTQ